MLAAVGLWHYERTYELLPGGGLVALLAEQPLPRLRLFELHPLPGSLPVPRALYSTAGERLRVGRIPEADTRTSRPSETGGTREKGMQNPGDALLGLTFFPGWPLRVQPVL